MDSYFTAVCFGGPVVGVISFVSMVLAIIFMILCINQRITLNAYWANPRVIFNQDTEKEIEKTRKQVCKYLFWASIFFTIFIIPVIIVMLKIPTN